MRQIVNMTVKNVNSYHKCGSCKVYILFMIVVFTILTRITIYFVYHKYVIWFASLNLIHTKNTNLVNAVYEWGN